MLKTTAVGRTGSAGPKRRLFGKHANANQAALALLLMSAACRNPDPSPAFPSAPIGVSASVAQADTALPWSRISADLTVRTTAPAPNLGPSVISQTLRIDGVRQPSGGWRTTVTFPPLAGDVRARPELEVGRLEIDEAGAVVAYARDGTQLSAPDPQQRRKAGIEVTAMLPPEARAGMTHARAVSTAGGSAGRWLSAFASTPGSRATLRTGVTGRFGPAMRDAKGVDRFTRVAGDSVVEIVLDPISGDLAETTLTVRGVRALQTTYKYALLSPGVFGRISARTERLVTGQTTPRTTEIIFANVTAAQ